MPTKPSLPAATQFPRHSLPIFGVANLGATQSQVALKINVNDATTGSLNITGIPAQFDGSIVGIAAVLTNNKTAGVFGISPTVAGTEVGSASPLYRVPIANAAKIGQANCDAGQAGLTFKQGDLIGCKVTTDGSFAAGATPDLAVIIYVQYDNVQM